VFSYIQGKTFLVLVRFYSLDGVDGLVVFCFGGKDRTTVSGCAAPQHYHPAGCRLWVAPVSTRERLGRRPGGRRRQVGITERTPGILGGPGGQTVVVKDMFAR